MGRYLITLEPMESYFFGGERTFGFGSHTKRKQPYYIVSENVPSQPTLFGTLRYIILSQKDLLFEQNEPCPYETRKIIENLIGPESFSFEKSLNNVKQSFGIINGISPVFLINDEEWYVRTPYDHNPERKEYAPFIMREAPVIFGDHITLYPEDYKAKKGYGGGYISLKTLRIISDEELFGSVVRTGINSHRTDVDSAGIQDENSFFKKERRALEKGFCFAFIADLSEELEVKESDSSIVFMGQDKSPFCCRISRTESSLIEKTKEAFLNRHDICTKYALSDIIPVSKVFSGEEKLHFYIADTKVMRNLETKVDSDACSYYARLKKSEKLYKVFNSGSVFFTEQDIFRSEALEKIGMNVLVNI